MVNILESRKTFVCYFVLWLVIYLVIRAVLHFVYNFESTNASDSPVLFIFQIMGVVLLSNHFTHKSYHFVFGDD